MDGAPPAYIFDEDSSQSAAGEPPATDDAVPTLERTGAANRPIPSTSYLERVPDRRLQPFWYSSYVRVTRPSDIVHSPHVLSSAGLVLDECTRFRYTRSISVRVATNVHGLSIQRFDDWGALRSSDGIKDLKSLTKRHRATLLMPTIDYWWHERSKVAMLALVNRVFRDLDGVTASRNLRAALKRHNIRLEDWPQVLRDSRAKYVSAASRTNSSRPGVFSAKVYHDNGNFTAILTHHREARPKLFAERNWSALLKPRFVHGLVSMNVSGVTITNGGVSIDAWVTSLGYQNLLPPNIDSSSGSE